MSIPTDKKEQLENLSKQYSEIQEEYQSVDMRKKAINNLIKQIMTECGIKKFISSSGVSLDCYSKPNISFDEEKLLAICKSLNIEGLVKTKEIVDMDVLESLIYNRVIDPCVVDAAKVTKPDTLYLKCKQQQILNE